MLKLGLKGLKRTLPMATSPSVVTMGFDYLKFRKKKYNNTPV